MYPFRMAKSSGRGLILVFTSLALYVTAFSSHSDADWVNPLATSPVTDIADVYGEETVYTISRNGKNVGTHRLLFRNSGSETEVEVKSSIRIRILGLTVYKLSYTSVERWKDNRLVEISATTVENGDSQTVSYQAGDDTQQKIYASNHWHPGVLQSMNVFNTLTGKQEKVRIDFLGEENVEIERTNAEAPEDSGVIRAHRFGYSYDEQVNSWYDVADGRWVKLSFKGRDNSTITYILRP